jgi:pyruvate dehydrogenase E1 component
VITAANNPLAPPPADAELLALDEIQRRVLWLATNIVHVANKVRPNTSGVKVGGHQASSASVVTVMTELFFDFMDPHDLISVKPHASPVLHAINYLMGRLDRSYLPTLRAFHGLQAYPSRTKDPDPVDFSTGSVGLGAVAPNFAALADQFVRTRFAGSAGLRRRFIALVGDAELDEGSVWEAIAEPALAGLDNLIWIVDLNRQSLDRVIPGIRVRQLEGMFRANGWTVIEAKYGRALTAAFARTGGDLLRKAIDEMSNESYQMLLRSPAAMIASVLADCVPEVPEQDLKELIADLGGHDFWTLRQALLEADQAPGPAVVFAYTIKGWGLPIAGDPLNHSALLTERDIADLRVHLGVPSDDEWAPLSPESPGGRLVAERGRRMVRHPKHSGPVPELPEELGRDYSGTISTQQAFGQILTAIARAGSEAAQRIITVSPDVATSTNLGGWINRVGVWSPTVVPDPSSEQGPKLVNWRHQPSGQHIELGISETNLLMLLGQLGLSDELFDEPLFPIGTLYDPFVARALDAYIYSVYSGSRFILVGTPSGVTLSPEGGAHQSVVTPSIGVALPRVTYWEPCFAVELEWILLDSLNHLHGVGAESAYLRLSTAPIDQSLLPSRHSRELRRTEVLSGSYCLVDRGKEPGARPENRVDLWATGVMVPVALQAGKELELDGIYASVFNCLSPDRFYRSWQARIHNEMKTLRPKPGSASAPIVTVIDGHPSALAWIGASLGVRCYPLGVTEFGESGQPSDLYAKSKIDVDSICIAAYAAIGAPDVQ